MTKLGMVQATLVRDVMTEAVVFIKAGTTAEAAADILNRHRINGAPVLGDHGHIVGVVSRTDLLDPRRRPADREMLVEDAMTRIVYAVRAADPAMQAVRLMVSEEIHRALVVHDDGTLAGIVAPMDILRGLARGLPFADGSLEPLQFVTLLALRNRQ